MIGDMLGATAPVAGPTIAATSSAAAPSNSKQTKAPETAAIADAKQSLWLAAFLVVLALAILGFGSKFLNNVRIA